MKNSLLLLFGILFFSCQENMKMSVTETQEETSKEVKQEFVSIPKFRIVELKDYLSTHTRYNSDVAIFVNFKIPSKKYRFFIYDMKNNLILDKSLVSHGSGSEVQGSDELVFSNIENSYQSSLGKYEIANHYKGRFGWSYRLKGLDKTNNKALKRAIVMHPYFMMRSKENGNSPVTSLGCFMLSPAYMNKITKEYIKPSKKPMLIYAFY